MGRAKFEFNCRTREACPLIIKTLKEMNFTDIKEVNKKSSSFDITAKIKIKKDYDKIIIGDKIYEKHKSKINELSISSD